jgi:hypothetical protein
MSLIQGAENPSGVFHTEAGGIAELVDSGRLSPLTFYIE